MTSDRPEIGRDHQQIGELIYCSGRSQLYHHIIRADMGHIGSKSAEHHDHHAQIAAAAHQQNFYIFNNIGSGIRYWLRWRVKPDDPLAR